MHRQFVDNVGKCKVMHFGRVNQKRDYYMKNQKLETTSTEKDLGIVITSDLKSSEQCSQAYSKASHVLGMIKRTIVYKSADTPVSYTHLTLPTKRIV